MMAAITNQAANASPMSTTANLYALVVPQTTASFHQDSYAMKQDFFRGALFVWAIKSAFILWVEFIEVFHINLFLFSKALLFGRSSPNHLKLI